MNPSMLDQQFRPAGTGCPEVAETPASDLCQEVAELSDDLIRRMSTEDLVRVIRAVRLPLLRPAVNRNLEHYDRQTLGRLAFLTRRCCRYRIRRDQDRSSCAASSDWSPD